MTIEELLPFLPNHVGGVVIYVSFCFSIRSLIRPVMATAQVFFRGSVLVPYRTSLAVSLIIIIRGEREEETLATNEDEEIKDIVASLLARHTVDT